jgi:hypothetical protein
VKELPSSTCKWLVLVESAVFSKSAEITTLTKRPTANPAKRGREMLLDSLIMRVRASA